MKEKKFATAKTTKEMAEWLVSRRNSHKITEIEYRKSNCKTTFYFRWKKTLDNKWTRIEAKVNELDFPKVSVSEEKFWQHILTDIKMSDLDELNITLKYN